MTDTAIVTVNRPKLTQEDANVIHAKFLLWVAGIAAEYQLEIKGQEFTASDLHKDPSTYSGPGFKLSASLGRTK